MIRLLLYSGDPNSALEVKQQLESELSPTKPSELQILGLLKSYEGKLLEAIEMLTEAQKKPGFHSNILKASLENKVGRVEESSRELDRLILLGEQQSNPELWQAAFDIALSRLDLGAARGFLAKLSAIDPAAAAGSSLLLALLYEGNPVLAEEFSSQGESFVESLYYGRFQRMSEQLESRYSKAYLPSAAVDAELALFQATVLMYEERWTEALECLGPCEANLSENPLPEWTARAYAHLCRVYVGEATMDEGHALLEEAQAGFPSALRFQADMRFVQLELHFAAQDFQGFLDEQERLISQEPRAFHKAMLYELKGRCLLNLGRGAEAEESFREVRRLAPGSFLDKRCQDRFRS